MMVTICVALQDRVLTRGQIDQFMVLFKSESDSVPPSLIYNCDETFLAPGIERTKVYTHDGVKIPRQVMEMDAHITLLLCIAADGKAMLPHCILPLVNLPQIAQSTLEGFSWRGSASGWINDKLFRDWVKTEFIPHCNHRRAELQLRPDAKVLLISDGHGSRKDLEMVTALEAASITLLILPAHSSTILQPLDMTVNGHFKRELAKNYTTPPNTTTEQRRAVLLEMTRMVLQQSMAEIEVKKGFMRASLVPFDPERAYKSPCVTPSLDIPLHIPHGINISCRVVTVAYVLEQQAIQIAKQPKIPPNKRVKIARQSDPLLPALPGA